MVKNAASTLLAFFAEVSRKGIPKLSANACGEKNPWEHNVFVD
jgi:hypothetical protein